MWARYYSTRFIRKDNIGNEVVDTEIFYVDSNILAKHTLEFLQNPYNIELNATNNQYIWLQKALKNSPAGNKIIAQHHPLQSYSKRAVKSDTRDYLTSTEETALKNKLGLNEEKINYAELLRAIYQKMGIGTEFHVQLVASAHDHHQAVTNANIEMSKSDGKKDRYDIPQLIAGGGGGRLQDHTKPSDDSLHYLDKAHGFSELEIDADGKKQLHCYTLMKNDEIREIIFDYSDKDNKPQWTLRKMEFTYPNCPDWINQFMGNVAAGIKTYQKNLKDKLVHNYKKNKKIQQADEVFNLLNQQYENNEAGFKKMVSSIYHTLETGDIELVKLINSSLSNLKVDNTQLKRFSIESVYFLNEKPQPLKNDFNQVVDQFNKAFTEFNNALKEIDNYGKDFQNFPFIQFQGKVANSLVFAAVQTFIANMVLANEPILNVIKNGQIPSKQVYLAWQTACQAAIKKATPVLSQHREWQGRLANLLIAITGIGAILMLGKGLVTWSTSGNADFQFFSTTSKQKLNQVAKALETVKLSKCIAPAA